MHSRDAAEGHEGLRRRLGLGACVYNYIRKGRTACMRKHQHGGLNTRIAALNNQRIQCVYSSIARFGNKKIVGKYQRM